jgi:hypothetical protein
MALEAITHVRMDGGGTCIDLGLSKVEASCIGESRQVFSNGSQHRSQEWSGDADEGKRSLLVYCGSVEEGQL